MDFMVRTNPYGGKKSDKGAEAIKAKRAKLALAIAEAHRKAKRG